MAIAQNETASPFSQPLTGPPAARRPLLDRCLIGILATLVVAVVRAWLYPVLDHAAAFAIFYIAIIFTAWYSGFWPALLATGV